MDITKRRQAGRALGCGLLAVALLRLAGGPRAHPPADALRAIHWIYPRSHSPRGRPFDAALREAVEWQQRAVDEASRHQEALKAWDPKAGVDGGAGASEDWQRQIARDEGGYLRRARAEAQRAAALARTPHEVCRAGALLAALECSRGHHDEELQQARRLVALEPGNELALFCLRRAARCNGLTRLEGQTTAALAVLQCRREPLPSPRESFKRREERSRRTSR